MDTTNESESEVDGEWRRSVSAPPVADGTESASSTSEETEPVVEEPPAPPPNQLKIDALRRLKALERRGKTVGTHLDELRALMTVLFELMPD